jgi:RNA polymerase sigma-70 factor (sigma-E family)
VVGGEGGGGIATARRGALALSLDGSRDETARLEFHRFFERHHRELARLACLLVGDPDTADDLAADALVAAWRRWDHIRDTDHPLAYVRRIVVNMSNSRLRTLVRERGRLPVLGATVDDSTEGPDVPAVLDVRAALRRLPARKRACLVLRYAFDLSEQETASVLGISVGTVKSQTSRAAAELERQLRGTGSAADVLSGYRAGVMRPQDRPGRGA